MYRRSMHGPLAQGSIGCSVRAPAPQSRDGPAVNALMLGAVGGCECDSAEDSAGAEMGKSIIRGGEREYCCK